MSVPSVASFSISKALLILSYNIINIQVVISVVRLYKGLKQNYEIVLRKQENILIDIDNRPSLLHRRASTAQMQARRPRGARAR